MKAAVNITGKAITRKAICRNYKQWRNLMWSNVIMLDKIITCRFSKKVLFDASWACSLGKGIWQRCTRGGEGGRGAPHVPPIKIFEKLPHKNAIKHDPPDFLTTPRTPRPPPPRFPTTVHLWNLVIVFIGWLCSQMIWFKAITLNRRLQ